MKKKWTATLTALGLIMALAIPVGAADLHEPHTNMTFDCDGDVVLHFVNNQTRGSTGSSILVNVNDGATTIVEGPSKELRNTNHYYVTIDGDDTLTDATTGENGRLVLSDYECVDDKK